MKRIINFESVQASEDIQRPEPGGYVVIISKAEDNPEREYLCIEFDIVEGDYTGYCSDSFARFGNWPALGRTYRSYKETALGMFKAFTEALEQSPENKGYKWDWNEDGLVGLMFGAVLGIEEYEAQDGTIKEGLKLSRCIPTGRIRAGDYKIPTPKRISRAASEFRTASASEIPFKL